MNRYIVLWRANRNYPWWPQSYRDRRLWSSEPATIFKSRRAANRAIMNECRSYNNIVGEHKIVRAKEQA